MSAIELTQASHKETSGAADAGRAIFIAWKRDCFRSYQTAKLLGCRLILVWPFNARGTLQIVARYVVSAVLTAGILLRERPRRLAILNLPLPLALIATLYAKLFRAELIFDCHSKPYAEDCPPLERMAYPSLSRAANLNINHNEHDAAVVRRWGGRNVVIEALPFSLPPEAGTVKRSDGGDGVLCVCSFAADEPIEIIVEAARALPGVTFKITGNYRKRSDIDLKAFPSNLQPTGYLSVPAYYEAVANAAIVLSLSRNAWIMHMASEEALLLGVPIVVSRSAVVEKVLGDAGIFVDLTTEAVVAGLKDALARRDVLAGRMHDAAARQRASVERTLAAFGIAPASSRDGATV